jgi:hypothetical protein
VVVEEGRVKDIVLCVYITAMLDQDLCYIQRSIDDRSSEDRLSLLVNLSDSITTYELTSSRK